MARVLIVDDSPTDTYQMKHILSRNGYEVIEAQSGESGVALAEEMQPDLVLMDIVMPGLNGFQATRQLTRGEKTREIPVVIVTTKNQESDKVWGERQGAKRYLTKPINEKLLINTVQDVLADA
jgi:twitching motility two-component system response regulator PilH